MIFSHSRIQAYLTCRRYFALSYIKELDAIKTTTPLLLGRAVHKYIDLWAKGMDAEICNSEYSKVFDDYLGSNKLLPSEQIQDILIEKARGLAMIEAYTDKNSTDKSAFKTSLPEQEVTFKLSNGHSFLSYTDRLVQTHDGEWKIQELKTVSSQVVTPDYFAKIPKDNQVLTYARAAKEFLGSMPKSVLWDMIIKTQHRQTKKESMDMFIRRLIKLYQEDKDLIHREEFIISPKAVQRWEDEMCVLTDEIVKNLEKKGDPGIWVRNTNQCVSNYGACKFLNICTTGKVDKRMYKKKSNDR